MAWGCRGSWALHTWETAVRGGACFPHTVTPTRTPLSTTSAGFPDDIQERELNNLLRFIPGYVASQMNWKNGQAQGFALFESLAACSAACAQLNSVLYDEAPPGFKLRAEVARKNMHALNDPVVPGGVKRQRFNDGGFGAPPPSAAPGGYGRPPPSYPPPGGYGGAPGGGYGGSAGGAPTFSVFTADDGPVAPVQPIAFRPVENSNDNPPCRSAPSQQGRACV